MTWTSCSEAAAAHWGLCNRVTERRRLGRGWKRSIPQLQERILETSISWWNQSAPFFQIWEDFDWAVWVKSDKNVGWWEGEDKDVNKWFVDQFVAWLIILFAFEREGEGEWWGLWSWGVYTVVAKRFCAFRGDAAISPLFGKTLLLHYFYIISNAKFASLHKKVKLVQIMK